ncbi:MAG: adenine phosphoribosyltransferase [Aeromicrobium sp.]
MPDISNTIDELVRPIEDWPVPGVTFRDITPLLADADALREVIEAMVQKSREVAPGRIDAVVGIEARGFIFAPAVAIALGTGFIPVRKSGKLPSDSHSVSYGLEYGEATIEMHADALKPGDQVLVIDDVLATGGTMAAATELVAEAGATVAGNLVLIELLALRGRDKLGSTPTAALRSY